MGTVGGGWTQASFEAALGAPPNHPERFRLVGDLVQHVFPFLSVPSTAPHRPGERIRVNAGQLVSQLGRCQAAVSAYMARSVR